VKGGLSRRTAIASALLALVVGAAFAIQLLAIIELRSSTQLRRETREGLLAADGLEKLVLDLETGLRGFVITGEERFLDPWNDARAALPEQASELERLVADDPVQRDEVRRIVQAATSYIGDYSVPLLDAVRRNEVSARSVERTEEGKRRVDALRAEFDAFEATRRTALTGRENAADEAGRGAIVAGVAGLAGSIILVLLFTGYVGRTIVRPIRQAAAMADRLAGGDLSTRMPEAGAGEIGALERSFNTMAGSLSVSRDELASSRARIVAAGDQTRRRIERDLHDGVQQRLVSIGLELRGAEFVVPPEMQELQTQMSQIAAGLDGVLEDIREISRGIHPAILSQGGLEPALKALARRSPVPVELNARLEGRLPERVEAAAYYVASEAVTNTAKHARASVAHIDLEVLDGALRLVVRDDGVGGADPAGGTGLIGLVDRVEAMEGMITVHSPVGGGTSISVELPVQS
jgi:signal transduction histidine kinase